MERNTYSDTSKINHEYEVKENKTQNKEDDTKALSGVEQTSVYAVQTEKNSYTVYIDFAKKNKSEAYRRINKILG